MTFDQSTSANNEPLSSHASPTSLHPTDRLFSKAREAQHIWAKLSYAERGVHIAKVKRYVESNPDYIADIIARATGKTRIEALAAEVIPAALACKWYSENSADVLAPRPLKSSHLLFINKRSALHRLPLGVVGIISPWNYPFAIPFGEIVMGLMAGNAVVLKVATNVAPVGIYWRKCSRRWVSC